MADWLNWFWQDTVWSKVIATIIMASITGIWARHGWFKKLRKPVLRMVHSYPSDQSTTGATYPLKYYLEVTNDSGKCVAVRVSSYKSNAVTLQKFVPSTLQVSLDGKWVPAQHSVEEVALLPNQRCRVWIGVDARKFTYDHLRTLEGKIGTVTLTANGKPVEFTL